MSTFNSLYSQCYDLLYANKDYVEEVNYVDTLIQKYGQGTSHILNLGCGTGKHDILFAQKGYTLHGVDLSEGMVKQAQKRVEELSLTGKLSFSKGDIRTERLNKTFDAVISLFHVLSYQTTNDDLEKSFQTASVHLKSGGLFVFDCWHGPAVLADAPMHKVKEVENDSIKVVRTTRPKVHYNEKVVDVNFEMEVSSKLNKSSEIFTELHRMRYLFMPELISIAEKSGLSLLATYKWMTFDEPSEKSWYVVYLFKKI